VILVKLKLYRQHYLVLRKNIKLELCYFGPFEIIQRILTTYKLLLPERKNSPDFSCFIT